MYYFHWNTINTTEVVDFIASVRIVFGWYIVTSKEFNRISGVMVSMIVSSAVDPRVKPETIKLIYVASLQRMGKSKDWLSRSQNNVPNGSAYLPMTCCFSDSIINTQLSVVV
jgi:hypothetical protein